MPNKPIILDESKIKLSVLKHLDKKGGIRNYIETRLSDTLKSRLMSYLLGRPESPLAKLIEEIKPVDIKSVMNLTLKGFLEKTVKHKIGKDKKLLKEYEELSKTLTDKTKIKDILDLDQPLGKNPIFSDIARNSHLNELLKLTPLKGKNEKINKFIEAFNKSARMHREFWKILDKEKIVSKSEIEDIMETFELSALALDNLKLVKALKAKKIKSLKDLVSYRKEDWLKLIEENKIDTPDAIKDKNKDEKPTEAYANHLSEHIANVFPTGVFFNRLNDHDVNRYKNDLMKIARFLKDNPKVKLKEGQLKEGLKKRKGKEITWRELNPMVIKKIKNNLENLNRMLAIYPGLKIEEILNNSRLKPDNKVKKIRTVMKKLDSFYENNPGIDLITADFHGGSYLKSTAEGENKVAINWEGMGEEREKVVKQLKTFQRLLRIHPCFETTEKLLSSGYDSAQKITLSSKDSFIKSLGEDTHFWRNLYKKALLITDKSKLTWVNAKEAAGYRSFNKAFFNNTSDEVAEYIKNLPGFQELFELPRFCDCKHCKSIFGPAAYFVDLMRFIDENITKKNNIQPERSLKYRRPGLWEMPLDCINTNRLISYLDIVNEVLERNVEAEGGGNAYAILHEAIHPFNLPFHQPLEQTRGYLGHFRKALLYELFKVFEIEEKYVAAEFLNISKKEFDVITTPKPDVVDLFKAYGNLPRGIALINIPSDLFLAKVEEFLKYTGLNRKELNLLLFQNLSDDEQARNVQQQFYINNVNDNSGSLFIKKINNKPNDPAAGMYEKIENLSHKKLDRIHRFIRLSKKLGWSFEDLDWVLKSIGKSGPNQDIDPDAILKIYKIKQWQEELKLPIDVLCTFWYDIKDIGKRNDEGPDPLDLFNRTFNNPDILEGRKPYDFNPLIMLDSQDPVHPNRDWLLSALEIRDEELSRIIRIPGNILLNKNILAHFYRMSQLPKALKIGVKEFLTLLDLMGINNYDQVKDFAVLERVIMIVARVKEAGFSVYELQHIKLKKVNDFVEAGYTEAQVRLLLEDLAKTKNEIIIDGTAFTAIAGVTENKSNALFDELVNHGSIRKVNVDDRFGKLVPNFDPDAPGFTLNLNSPFDAAEEEAKVVKILKRYDQRRLILEQMAVFFEMEPAHLKETIKLSGLTLDNQNILQAFAAPIEENVPISQLVSVFLETLHAYVVLVKKLSLTGKEVAAIHQQAQYLNINNMQQLFPDDVMKLYKFKQLCQSLSEPGKLLDFFTQGDKQAKIAKLAELFHFDRAQLETLITKYWPPDPIDPNKIGFNNLKDVIKIKKRMDLSLFLGLSIDMLLSLTEFNNGNWDVQKRFAKSILETFKAKYGEKDWNSKYEPLVDQFREKKRDALASWLIWKYEANKFNIHNREDLYQHLLIDVGMSSCQKVSRVKEGLNALQLYVHRCLMNIEKDVKPESIPRKQWKWMKNYRVWEANRKVFLYPENYIEPELRDNKTPIFKELEDELLQADITKENVEKAYRNYMNKFVEVANLKIAGNYYHEDQETNTNILYLVGRTNTEPYMFYYRKYINETTWTPWEKIDLRIKHENVSPIIAFNRLFLFWLEVLEKEKPDHGNYDKYTFSIKYSYLDFNEKWITPQTLHGTENMIMGDPNLDVGWQRVYPIFDNGKTSIALSTYPKINIIELYNNFTIKQIEYSPLNKKFLLFYIYHVTSSSRGLIRTALCVKQQGQMMDSKHYYFDAAKYSYFGERYSQDFRRDSILYFISSRNSNIKIINKNPVAFIFDNGDEELLIKFSSKTGGVEIYFTRISTRGVFELSSRLFTGGIDELLKIESQKITEKDFSDYFGGSNSNLWKDYQRITRDHLPFTEIDLNFNSAYGQYYREIFFHIPFLVANRLNANQRFKEAQKWYHYIFDPTAAANQQLTHPNDRYWQYLPFRDQDLPSFEEMLTNEAALAEYHNNPFKPHAIARLRISAYQKAIVLKYIDNLVDWAEHLFRQDGWESITEATMLYVMAYQILGGKPPEELEPCPMPPTKTYQEIEDNFESGADIPEFRVELENAAVPAGANSHTRMIARISGTSSTPTDAPYHGNSILYFCFPENKKLHDYWEKVEKGLYKIRHCLDITGTKRELALFQPPIDPMVLVRAAAGGRDISSVLSDLYRPLPHYRFNFLIEKTRNFISQVQQLGSAFLSALEKKDAENLALLRSSHEQNILDLTTALKEKQIEESSENHAALLESKKSAESRNKHYQELIKKGYIESEDKYFSQTDTAKYLNLSAGIGKLAASTARLTLVIPGGHDLGQALEYLSGFPEELSKFYGYNANMNSTAASFTRRRQDWELQEKLSKHDIDQIDKQIKAAELRKMIAERDLEIHEKNIEQSEELYEFMKDKFTNEQLYQWKANQLAGLYFQAYNMAYDLAKSTEKAYQYERNTNDTFINFGHWDSLKKGLLSGERLMLDINRMEKAYLENNTRTLEIEKTISLAQLPNDEKNNSGFPTALTALKDIGVCVFKLTNTMFELDYPGHYCRKIKNITISIPAIVGPYENIKATLTQLSNHILIKPDNLNQALIIPDQRSVELNSNHLNVRTDWRSNEKIAVSRGVNDSGLFELNFRDERYLPFEGTGVVSRWRLEIPKRTNTINFDSLANVIINLKYTALFDGDLESYIRQNLKKVEGHQILSLKHEFSTQWHRFMNPLEKKREHVLEMPILENLLPPNLENYDINDIYLKIDFAPHVLSPGGNLGGHLKLSLKPANANEIDFQFYDSDIDNKAPSEDQKKAFGNWVIKVDRKIGIPPQLIRKKNDGTVDVENINGDLHYYLDPEKVKNIWLILVYEGDIVTL